MTPAFWGAEPAIADRGPYAGLRECDVEQPNGLELIRALSLPQQMQALSLSPFEATSTGRTRAARSTHPTKLAGHLMCAVLRRARRRNRAGSSGR
jgi:hypothetical protein